MFLHVDFSCWRVVERSPFGEGVTTKLFGHYLYGLFLASLLMLLPPAVGNAAVHSPEGTAEFLAIWNSLSREELEVRLEAKQLQREASTIAETLKAANPPRLPTEDEKLLFLRWSETLGRHLALRFKQFQMLTTLLRTPEIRPWANTEAYGSYRLDEIRSELLAEVDDLQANTMMLDHLVAEERDKKAARLLNGKQAQKATLKTSSLIVAGVIGIPVLHGGAPNWGVAGIAAGICFWGWLATRDNLQQARKACETAPLFSNLANQAHEAFLEGFRRLLPAELPLDAKSAYDAYSEVANQLRGGQCERLLGGRGDLLA